MRVYVAAKFECAAEVRRAYGLLRAAGHEVTCAWAEMDVPPKSDWTPEYLAGQSRLDVLGVLEADALIVVPHDRGKGLFVELGVALAMAYLWGPGNPLLVGVGERPGPESCLFLHDAAVEWVPTVEAAVARLGSVAQ